MTEDLPAVPGNTRAERRALRLQHESAAGQETPSAEGRVWFLPSGTAKGERNAHRLRGWAIAVSAALVIWGVIAVVVGGLAGLF